MTDAQTGSSFSQEIIDGKWFFWSCGVAAIIAGMLAILLPHLATMAANIVIGALLAGWGLVSLFYSRRSAKNAHLATSIFSALLAILGGAAILVFPFSGIFALTTLMVFYFAVSGAARVYLGWQRRHADGWGWIIASGLISLILALFILGGLPGTAFWALGLILGIDLIMYGTGLIAIVLHAQRRIALS